jgi:hypothetical protein
MPLSDHSFTLFGSSLRSELDLDLPLSFGPGQIEVVCGSVRREGDLIFETTDPLPFACYRKGGAIVLVWTDCRFRIIADQVVIDTNDVETAVQLLIPSAWSVVLSAHERESLHGAAVECDGEAIAILGNSGSGKTTAARSLIDRGCRLISDDLLTFDSELRVVPGPPWMRLVPSPDHDWSRDSDAGGKLRIYPPLCSEPIPLSAIVIMAPEYNQLVLLSGTSGASALFQQVYNPVVTHPGQVERRFHLVHDLVASVPIYGAAPRSLSANLLLHLCETRTA